MRQCQLCNARGFCECAGKVDCPEGYEGFGTPRLFILDRQGKVLAYDCCDGLLNIEPEISVGNRFRDFVRNKDAADRLENAIDLVIERHTWAQYEEEIYFINGNYFRMLFLVTPDSDETVALYSFLLERTQRKIVSLDPERRDRCHGKNGAERWIADESLRKN